MNKHSYPLLSAAVMAGGAAGALSRMWLNPILLSAAGNLSVWGAMPFPVGILCINVLGSLLMGALQGAMSRHQSALIFALCGTGFLGGFTTFSAFSLDTLRLYEAGGIGPALLNIGLNVGLGVAAAGLGYTALRKTY